MGKMVRTTLRCIAWKGWLLLACWLMCSYNVGNPVNPTTIQALYKKASHLFKLDNPTDATDSLALATFQQVIDLAVQQGTAPDSLLFFAHLRKGILLDNRANFAQALEAYRHAQHIKKRNSQWSDSLSYEVAELTGSVYYHLNNFDSASYYLLQAEALAQRFPGIPVIERLYNDLGVLYYENGNYLQSRNYFTHALEIINKNPTKDAASIVYVEINIAAACNKLGLYQQAIAIYKTICNQKVYNNHIFLNMGVAYKAMGNYPKALEWLHKVNAVAMPRVYNELAHTHLQLNQPDSANYYLNRYQHQLAAHKAKHNTTYTGMNFLYRGDLLVQQQQYEAALQAYQQAIVVFSGHFRDTDPNANPASFTGTFTSYRLFDALLKKGSTFEALYKANHNEAHATAALATYTSAIALLRYIEKSCDTDDAKLFLKNNNQQVYQYAVGMCLQLQQLHPGAGYQQQAFVIAERNKASVMYSGLTEKGFRKLPGIDPSLIQQERNIKYNLARLSIKSDQTTDSTALASLTSQKAAFEIQLAQVQHAIEQNSVYYKLKYSESYPHPDTIQQYITSQQAVISFYATGNTLNVFVITKWGFKQIAIDPFAAIQQNIRQWLAALQSEENGRRFKGAHWGALLYKQLVQPLQSIAGDKTEWIIIPDNLLYYLPFESLPASAGNDAKPLLETNEISYQFSSQFIVTNAAKASPAASLQTLAFAPFAKNGITFPHHEYNYLQQLPASAQEIAQLPGRSFTDQQATKHQFVTNLNQYPIVHLATHAIADTGNPAASFIAFYPTTQQPNNDALYLEELYGLNMDATRLLIISACETGHGQLVNSEGVLSLTRGFAYAGCASIVNSLWKADDEATAAILRQFHIYLQKGYTKSKALRQAKLDYLHSNALHKTPNYWAHLIITGDTQPLVKAGIGNWWLLVLSGMAAVVLVGIILLKGKKSRRGLHRNTD
ncbi:CHAT domain-containing protein [Niastella caeni]|uniref:CHAT domain-containing protein n=1 Tax=Niastella caeni TaxID=2569763 RepID=A0A4S8I1C2_9BACT|nr:CHAT domain-containing tetratricopeptide repeat protein [Niastella caeni]THU39482.1 CHAT domain-containing protein [Niastella caeni]